MATSNACTSLARYCNIISGKRSALFNVSCRLQPAPIAHILLTKLRQIEPGLSFGLANSYLSTFYFGSKTRPYPCCNCVVSSRSQMSDSSKDSFYDDLERRLTVDVLNLEQLDNDLFRGTHLWKPSNARSVFGGQIVGQALVAAGRTVPNALNLHSMHSYFVRPGDSNLPVIYKVSRTRDGTSFSSRTVSAIQRGVSILVLQASFHNETNEEPCHLEFQPNLPKQIKHHSELLTTVELAELFKDDPSKSEILKHFTPEIPIEVKPVLPDHFLRKKEGIDRLLFWVRAKGNIGADQNLHRCVASYISDWALLWSALLKNPRVKVNMMTSLDHSLWFHKPLQMDEWMLYECKAITGGHNRALCHGRLWRDDGQLAATVVQEGIIRGKL